MLNPKILKNKLDNSIFNKYGPIWTAAKNSYRASYGSNDSMLNSQEMFSNVNNLLEANSIKFADEFINSLKQKNISNTLSLIIDDYIKTAGLSGTIIIPDPSNGSTLISPAGPVTGVINLSPITSKIKLL